MNEDTIQLQRELRKGLPTRSRRREQSMFAKAFQATMGVLVALFIWSVLSGLIALVVIRLLER